MSKQAQDSDKIKTIGQLRRKLQETEMGQFRLMFAMDFSISNKWEGFHDLNTNNPIIQTIRAMEPSMSRMVRQGPISAFRFGCKQSEDFDCIPLNYPVKQDAKYETVEELVEGYRTATQTVEMYGPSQLTPVFRKAISVSAENGHKELLVCVIFTDGDVEDIKLDCETLQEVSKFPICFVAIGLGRSNFDSLEKFDDMKLRKFDNFQLVRFNEVFQMMQGRVERPDLIMTLAMFNELPAAILKIRKAGLLQ